MNRHQLRTLGIAVGVLTILSVIGIFIGAMVSMMIINVGTEIMIVSTLALFVNLGTQFSMEHKSHFQKGFDRVFDM